MTSHAIRQRTALQSPFCKIEVRRAVSPLPLPAHRNLSHRHGRSIDISSLYVGSGHHRRQPRHHSSQGKDVSRSRQGSYSLDYGC